MAAITVTNSLGFIIAIVGIFWYLISAWSLRKYFVQNYDKTIKSRFERIYIIKRLIFGVVSSNEIKGDKKLNSLVWHTRISLLVIMIGAILIFLKSPRAN